MIKILIQRHCEILINQGVVVLDTETTGLKSHDEIVEIALVSEQGGLIDTLIIPTRPISAESTAIHGITTEDAMDGAAYYPTIKRLKHLLKGVPVAIYNAVYDERLLEQTASFHHCESLNPILEESSGIVDVMEMANRYFSDWLVWDGEYGASKFKRLSLARCCEIAGIEFQGKAHRARADAQATYELVAFMANVENLSLCPDYDESVIGKPIARR